MMKPMETPDKIVKKMMKTIPFIRIESTQIDILKNQKQIIDNFMIYDFNYYITKNGNVYRYLGLGILEYLDDVEGFVDTLKRVIKE